MTEPLVIRVSGLSYAADCFRRWAAWHLWPEVVGAGYQVTSVTKGIGAAVGTAVHSGARQALEEKRTSGALPKANVVEDVTTETLREEIQQGVQYDNTSPNQNQAEFQARRMGKAYLMHIAPLIEPTAIEEGMTAPVPFTRQRIILSGHPDIVARAAGEVDDLKAGMRYGNYAKQIGGYSLLARTAGIEINRANIDHVPRAGVKRVQPKPERHPLDVGTSEREAEDTIRALDRSLTVFREGDAERGVAPGDPAAFPANPQSMLCGAKYCPAWGGGPRGWCQAWRK